MFTVRFRSLREKAVRVGPRGGSAVRRGGRGAALAGAGLSGAPPALPHPAPLRRLRRLLEYGKESGKIFLTASLVLFLLVQDKNFLRYVIGKVRQFTLMTEREALPAVWEQTGEWV